ncbi:YegP family protein [Empedobacter falsenii]
MFEIYQDKAGEYRFRLKARNGQIIGTSQSYETESGAKNGIASVKTNALDAEVKEVEG